LLFVVNNPAFFLSHRLPLAEEARRRGYEVHLCTPEGKGAERIRALGFPFHPMTMARGSRAVTSEVATLLSLWSVMRKVQPDLVHHVTIKPVLYGTWVARLCGVPAVVNAISGLGYVFLAKGFKASVVRTLVGLLYAETGNHRNVTFVVQNDDDATMLRRLGALRDREPVRIPGSGVDLNLFEDSDEPTSNLPLVVVPARLLSDKGIVEFVEAARLLRQRGVQARFALVGDRDEANPACIPERTLAEWASEGVVELWGYRRDMPQVFREAAIVCLPSYREGLPKALQEAAGAGRAIVTTDVPGCRDVVRSGENGLLVPVKDSLALADALGRLLQNPQERRRMGKAGRRRAEEEFGVPAIAEATMKVYENALARTAPDVPRLPSVGPRRGGSRSQPLGVA
jgi:glycosyltransferase involved in cell wall biosynthesis